MLLVVVLAGIVVYNQKCIDIQDVRAKHRISFMNQVLRQKSPSIHAMENLVLMDIERIGEGFLVLDDLHYEYECWDWSKETKEKYVELLENSQLKFTKKKSFRRNYLNGLERLEEYCQSDKNITN